MNKTYEQLIDSFEERLLEQAFRDLTPKQLEKIASAASEMADEFMHLLKRHPELAKDVAHRMRGMVPVTWRDFGGQLAMGAAMGGGGLLAMKGINAISEKVHDARLSLGKAKAYKTMLDANPQLSENGVDATAVQRHFDTLYRFNPQYAQDPSVAGTYVQNAIEMARPSLDTINNLVGARKNLSESLDREHGKPMDLRAVNSAMKYLYDTSKNLGVIGEAAQEM